VGRPRPAGSGVTVVDVYPRASLLAERSQDVVRGIRSLDPPFTTAAGGETARLPLAETPCHFTLSSSAGP